MWPISSVRLPGHGIRCQHREVAEQRGINCHDGWELDVLQALPYGGLERRPFVTD